jgi:TetR/AcrR family transcriptional regulator, lmrAB and yxaGH operons repressor
MHDSNSRKRFLQATERLLRERGYSATGTNDIVSVSGSPKGSLYFHFPGGKEELAALALTAAGNNGCDSLRLAFSLNKTVEGALKTVFAFSVQQLQESGFRAGCPIGTIAAEAPESRRSGEVVANVFSQWHAVIKERLMRSGVRSNRAGELAEFILTAYEGSLVLAKAGKTSKPIENALRQIIRLLRQENVR